MGRFGSPTWTLVVLLPILAVCDSSSSSSSWTSLSLPWPWTSLSSLWAPPASRPPRDCQLRLRDNILRRTQLLLALLEDFVDLYAQEKFANSWAVMDAIFSPDVDAHFVLVCDQELECEEVLPRLPSSPSPSLHPEDLLQLLLALSRRYALALELVFLDQSLHQDDLLLLDRTDQIYRHVQGLVDAIVAQVDQCPVDTHDAGLARLTTKLYKGVSSDGRDQRGFRTLRQCLLGLRYIRSLL
ncbi:uncharacterized protein LOC122265268 [Penaeus japonicus]|uniref:uncharacterized protein LOC122265268 n=1 Tax=Penaeus japonicus TaxID=27405 RepID=UPI001C7143D1|nr:uncharacterized protein LOC122265268 [Penaeus japonicus]